jgi:hypothetical protein
VVKLEVMNNGAIYINGTRITNRSTKPYGWFRTVFEADVDPDMVMATLKANQFDAHRIDPDYAREQGINLDDQYRELEVRT